MSHEPKPNAARDEIEEHWKAVAAALVLRISQALSEQGWHFAALSIARVVPVGRDIICPGSSVLAWEDRMTPGLPAEARSLRNLAGQIDKAFAESGSKEAGSSHEQEVFRR